MKLDAALITLLGLISVKLTLSFSGIKAPFCRNQRCCLAQSPTFLTATPKGGNADALDAELVEEEPESRGSDFSEAEVVDAEVESNGNDFSDAELVDAELMEFASEEEKKEAVGNLVADDEWMGLTMELTELIRLSVIEDLKKNTRDFLGKDEYKIGDISKKIDVRVKEEVVKLRGKEDGEYELGDLILAMDQMSKEMTEDLTGKPYETGDLSIELDKRIKGAVAKFCGKEEYEFGDLSKEITSRVSSRVEAFTGKPYEFGDVTKEVNKRRKVWVTNLLGAEAAENYKFGDITKKALGNFAGKDYEFGDVSKKLYNNLFGKRKRGGSDTS
jgi:hypothetical protein